MAEAMNEPLVSILIPVYNRESLVLRAIQSACQQTYQNIEIIVVDNCSSDRTYEVVLDAATRDARIRCFRNSENLGPVPNWRKCLELSRGEFTQYLFSDDWLDRSAVSRLAERLAASPSTGFAYSAVTVHFQASDRTLKAYARSQQGATNSFEFLRGYLGVAWPVPVSPGCALFRRKDLIHWLAEDIPDRLKLGCHGQGMGYDLLLFLRACDEYPVFQYVDEALCHFYSHSGSFSEAPTDASRSRYLVCYDAAFCWFLATSKLSRDRKRYCNTLMRIRSWGTSRQALLGPRGLSQLFPAGYAFEDVQVLSWDAFMVCIGWLWRKIKKCLFPARHRAAKWHP